LHGINNTWELGQYIIPGRVYDASTMLPNKDGHKFPVFGDRIDGSHFIISHQFTVTNNVSMKDSGELSLKFFIIHSHFTGCLNFKKIKGNYFHHAKIAFNFMIIKHKKQPQLRQNSIGEKAECGRKVYYTLDKDLKLDMELGFSVIV